MGQTENMRFANCALIKFVPLKGICVISALTLTALLVIHAEYENHITFFCEYIYNKTNK